MTFVHRDRAIFALCVAFCLGMFGLVLPNVAFAATFVTFDVPGAEGIDPSSINPAGVITGQYGDGSRVHGFVRATNGTITTFDAPGSDRTFALSINPAGVITGFYRDGSGLHGFVRAADGTITTFDAPGTGFFELARRLVGFSPAGVINPTGVITGAYDAGSGVPHGFVRTP